MICEFPGRRLHIISKAAWKKVADADPALEKALSEWHKIAADADWKSMVDVRQVYPHADFVDPFTVFNLKGNKYRLIVKIEYRWSLIFVKHVLTHSEYMRKGWKR